MQQLECVQHFPHFSHLNQDVLDIVLRGLAPVDLARLCCTTKELNDSIKCLDVWETLVRTAWRLEKAGGVLEDRTPADWKRMYGSRLMLPRSFVLACDVVGTTTQSIQKDKTSAGGSLPGFMLTAAFEKVARALATGISGYAKKGAASRSSHQMHKTVAHSRELALCKQDVAWWLQEAPQVVVGFARQARNAMLASPASSCSCGATSMTWQLKALTCLLGLAEAEMHLSFSSRLASEVELLEASLAPKQPGVPSLASVQA